VIRALARSDVTRLALLAVPAVVVFAMAYDNGAYSLPSRNFWAIVSWWAIILVVASRALPLRAIGLPAFAVGGLLSAFALLTLLSASWGSSAERAVNEFNRVSLYLGVFALVVCFSRGSRARWCDGLALGISAVAAVSLISRFFPERFSDRGLAEALPEAATRLSFPLGYWNGLAILAALAVPLLLRAASAPGPIIVRATGVALLPALSAVMYLASSRGGVGTAAIGAAAFLLLSRERWWTAAALAVGGAGCAVAVARMAERSAFVNQPESALGREQSNAALLDLVVSCLVAGGAYAVLVALLRGRRAPSKWIGIATAAVGVVALLAAIVAVDPLSRFRDFKRPPGEALIPTDDFVRSHLLSANGSGRWQFWESASDAFQARPFRGHGAGSFEAWWAEHGTLAVFIQDAHSLYLEVLAELGVFGLLLLVAAFSVALLTALRRLRRLSSGETYELAAPTAVFLAFVAAAAIDWVWELTVVSVVAFACLALMVGPLPESGGRDRRLRLRPALVVTGLTTALLVVCMQAIPYLSELRLRTSQEAAARGDGTAALDAAQSAQAIQPWAASPWLQIALVREELGDLRAARSAIARAREHDSSDWRLWLVSARLQTKLGDVPAARASLRRARGLNPRSPLFHDG